MEELYPFPAVDIESVIAAYPNLRELVWLQEEPRNMGPWKFMSSRLRALVTPAVEVLYTGRPEAASPAEGSGPRHAAEQARILSVALEAAPDLSRNGKRNGNGTSEVKSAEPLTQRSAASHAR